MNPRKLLGAVAFVLLLLFGWGGHYVTGVSQDDWPPWWKLTFVLAVCAAMFAALYDRKNLPEKAWDFNPKRGLLYFLLGWIIFPVTLGIRAMSGSEISLSHIVLGTFALSLLIGIVGTFTENVGV